MTVNVFESGSQPEVDFFSCIFFKHVSGHCASSLILGRELLEGGNQATKVSWNSIGTILHYWDLAVTLGHFTVLTF